MARQPWDCPGKSIICGAVSMLIVDAASRVDDELYRSMRPMLATTNGAVRLLSTPHRARGFFHRVWTAADGEDWLRILAPATECPRIPAEFLAQERRAQGERMFRHYSESVVIPSRCLHLS
jgi:hypothetical protein